MNGGIYRHDPPPTQGRRFVPIPAQGDQPPLRTSAIMMALVLASWPNGAEYQPPQQRRAVAPLTLTYGEEPPRRSLAVLCGILDAWWSAGPQPWQLPRKVVPLTQVSDAPPRGQAFLLALVRSAWEPSPPPPQRDPKTIAPLTLVYGEEPPRRSLAVLCGILDAWSAGPQPWQLPRKVVPLTQVSDAQAWTIVTRGLAWTSPQAITFVIAQRAATWQPLPE